VPVGARKAAMLLRSLDSATAAELLKSATPEVITEIAAEMAYLDVAGRGAKAALVEPVQEFYSLLTRQGAKKDQGDFLRDMLQSTLGAQRSQEVLGQVEELVFARDPFLPIRTAAVEDIARALEGESAQVAAIVLSELPTKSSAALLALLGDEVRTDAVRGMISGEGVSPQARQCVASVVQSRLESFRESGEVAVGPEGGQPRQQLRKVAVLLRGLGTELRDGLIKAIADQDQEAAATVRDLMVTWDDLAYLADRPVQESLRGVDARDLALALVDADEAVVNKIRANISERAVALLDEEASLLSSPKPDEVEQCRESILKGLRELNARGDLAFEEQEA
jgi:flagellar motor switch protein FliG